MKKVLVLCLLAVMSKAQITGTVVLTSVDAGICRGQEFKISFKYIGAHQPNKYFGFNLMAANLANYQLLFTQVSGFYGMNKTVVGPDTIYSFNAIASPTIPIGYYHLQVLPDGNYPGKNINLSTCVGIEEYELPEQSVIYYDLYGNIIEPRKNELIIKRVGNKLIKTIIQ